MSAVPLSRLLVMSTPLQCLAPTAWATIALPPSTGTKCTPVPSHAAVGKSDVSFLAREIQKLSTEAALVDLVEYLTTLKERR